MTAIIEARLVGGRLGNKMFQLMLAHVIASRVPGAVITGDKLPEFGWDPPEMPTPARSLRLVGHQLRLAGNRVDLGRVVYMLKAGLLDGVVTSALGCRMDMLPTVDEARAIFRNEEPEVEGFGPDCLVINVRAPFVREEGGGHPSYCPLPFAYYDRLIAETGLRPVFLGQINRDPHAMALRARFPGAEFFPSRGAMVDFAALRRSRHICVAVSTFSWLAAWLSGAETIHMPVAGMFHPGFRNDIDLLPVGDRRYRFQLFPAKPWTGTPAELAETIDGKEVGREIGVDEILAMLSPPSGAEKD